MAEFYCTVCDRQMFSQPYWESHINGRPHKEKVMEKMASEGKVEAKRFKPSRQCYVCLSDHDGTQDLREHEESPEHKAKLEALFKEAETHINMADGNPPIIMPGEPKVIGVVKGNDGKALVTLYAKYHL